eukprot:365922-Chlamydomonas_euryale.AAC.7
MDVFGRARRGSRGWLAARAARRQSLFEADGDERSGICVAATSPFPNDDEVSSSSFAGRGGGGDRPSGLRSAALRRRKGRLRPCAQSQDVSGIGRMHGSGGGRCLLAPQLPWQQRHRRAHAISPVPNMAVVENHVPDTRHARSCRNASKLDGHPVAPRARLLAPPKPGMLTEYRAFNEARPGAPRWAGLARVRRPASLRSNPERCNTACAPGRWRKRQAARARQRRGRSARTLSASPTVCECSSDRTAPEPLQTGSTSRSDSGASAARAASSAAWLAIPKLLNLQQRPRFPSVPCHRGRCTAAGTACCCRTPTPRELARRQVS